MGVNGQGHAFKSTWMCEQLIRGKKERDRNNENHNTMILVRRI